MSRAAWGLVLMLAACSSPAPQAVIPPDQAISALEEWKRTCAGLKLSEAWQAACRAAGEVSTPAQAGRFFERYFTQRRISGEGLLTGYYVPTIEVCVQPTSTCAEPLYAPPPELLSGEPYLTRAQIEDGALRGRGLEIAWAKDPVDVFFLQVQGSGRAVYPDGMRRTLRFAARNHQPYVALGKLLIERGALKSDEVNLFTIKSWLRAHPAEARALMQQNPSYVFFSLSDEHSVRGGSGMELSSHSLAVDPGVIPYGTPVWIESTWPDGAPLRELRFAHDTGTAIRGPGRADLFLDTGDGARDEHLAGHMKQRATFTILEPR